jgi:hypothetical protein
MFDLRFNSREKRVDSHFSLRLPNLIATGSVERGTYRSAGSLSYPLFFLTTRIYSLFLAAMESADRSGQPLGRSNHEARSEDATDR